jgi:hypothetical protein
MQRLRVQYPDRREKAVGHAGELIPGKERPLAAPLVDGAPLALTVMVSYSSRQPQASERISACG